MLKTVRSASLRVEQLGIPILIFLVVLSSHFSSGKRISSDSRYSIHTAVSMIKEGNTDLDEYAALFEENDYRIENIRGQFYTRYPIGVSIVAVPFVYVIDKGLHAASALAALSPTADEGVDDAGKDGPDADFLIKHHRKVETFIASFVVALTSVFLYLIALQQGSSRKFALCIVFTFAFCTSAWSTASRGLWQHGPSMLMLTTTLYLLLAAEKSARLAQFASIPLAFSYVVRPTNAISILFLTIFVLIRHREYFVKYILWASAIGIPFLIYNYSIYHCLLSPYYFPRAHGMSANFLEALAGNLVSPARGLFIFSPILLFSIYCMILKARRGEISKLDWFLIAILLAHWMTISFFANWWGGHSYGPRFFSDMIPYLVYFLLPLGPTIQKATAAKKGILITLFSTAIIISFLIQYRGANHSAVLAWNVTPAEINSHPSRLWDWHDVPFLRGI